tara:strand:- start:469 stop:1476 length:1008 start_codon:yes stop_codon:yes gene_type:complete
MRLIKGWDDELKTEARIGKGTVKNRSDTFFVVLIFCLLLCFSFPVFSEIYSWKDEYGNTHFGDKVLEGTEQKKVDLKVQESEWEKYLIKVNDVDNILTDKELLQIRRDVGAVYQFFDEKLYFDIYKTIPISIRLYKTQESYNNYLESMGSKNKKGSRGIYLTRNNEVVVFINKKYRLRTFWTIKHEIAHAIVASLIPFVPAWLNEGLAENMESLEVMEGIFILHPHNENYRSASRRYRHGEILNLTEFLSVKSADYYKNMKDGQNSYQAYAGELVRMLLSSETGKSLMRRLIHTYKRGSRAYSSYLVDDLYVGGTALLQQKWDEWLIRPSEKLRL